MGNTHPQPLDLNNEQLERLKHQLASEAQHNQAVLDRGLEAFRVHQEIGRGLRDIGASYAVITFKTLAILNGGGAIGLLTFISNVWGKNTALNHHLISRAATALTLFVIGLTGAAATAGFSYVSQVLFLEEEKRLAQVAAKAVRWIAILTGVASLALFLIGALRASAALRHLG